MPEAMHAKGFAWLEPAGAGATLSQLLSSCGKAAEQGRADRQGFIWRTLIQPAVRTVDVEAFCS